MRYMIGAALIAASGAASAQQEPWQEYDKFIKSAQVIKAEGPQLFGDSVNLYTGATTFAATDVSLPGNSGLPVALGRSFAPMNDHRNRPFSDWDWDIPYIGGTFGHELGWVLNTSPFSTAGTVNRCSAATSLSTARPPQSKVEGGGRGSDIKTWEYWSGYQLVTPSGGQEVLLATADSKPRPADGKVYPWVTKQFWYLSCLPSLSSGQAGEGFLAVSPEGVRYRFDWMVARPTLELLKPTLNEGVSVSRRFLRDDIRLYPTRVEDRFGNWVEYQWTGARLDRIVANDGRQLNLTWEADGSGGERVSKVATATVPAREWRYGYSQYRQLTSVTLPDNSRWQLNLGNLWGTPDYDPDQEGSSIGGRIPKQDKALTCSWMRVLLPTTRTASILHPSGALANFEFRTVRHGRNFVPLECMTPPDTSLRPEPDTEYGEESLFAMIPARFDVLALQAKRVSGPGLPSYQWNYSYVTPVGGWTDCPNCVSSKTTSVTAPDGVRTVYTYGVVFNDNEGQVLKTEVSGQDGLARSSQNQYVGNADMAGQPFSDRIGQSPQQRLDSFSSERLRPSKGGTVLQDGVSFSTAVVAFDAFANPVKTTQSSGLGYSRTDSTELHHDLAQWVLGQPRKSVNEDTGAVVSQTDYDPASALALRTYTFGKLRQSYGYHPDGTLASVTDGRNLTTRLDEWKRGRPQWVRFHDGSQERIVVDDNGWVTAVTDEVNATTQYAYDPMGRMNRITRPTGDDTAWSQTFMAFEQVNTEENGLAPGHWRQIIAAGNYKKIVYFDGLWRPVAEQEEDISNAADTLRWSAKRYDHEGLTVFASYPRNPIAEGYAEPDDSWLKGTHSSYDALGRPTRSVQDSENGQLTSTVQYLTGFKRRSTNARGIVSEESFQVFGEPSYERPVQIDAAVGRPERARTTIDRDVFGEVKAITRGSAP